MQYAYKVLRFMLYRVIIMLCCQVMGASVIIFGNYSSMGLHIKRGSDISNIPQFKGMKGGVTERHFEKNIYISLLVSLSTFIIRFINLSGVPRNFFGGGATNSVEDRENGDLGAVDHWGR